MKSVLYREKMICHIKRMLLSMLTLSAVLLPCCIGTAEEGTEPETSEWTVMFYLCGSDLESKYGFATGNLQEILGVEYPDTFVSPNQAGGDSPADLDPGEKPEKVNVLIETGGSKKWHGDKTGMEISTDSLQRWRFNCVSYFTGGLNHGSSIELMESCPLANMADPATLTDFIRWGTEICPAKKYALILWDHGGGAMTGLFIDELFDNDIMHLYELKQALDDSGVQLEALVIDACLMANLETAWAVKDSAHWMVASEETVPGRGTAIKAWLRELYSHPECDGRQLGRTICDMTQIKYAGEEDAESQAILTWSVIDLTKIEKLAGPLERFFREISLDFTQAPDMAILIAKLFHFAEEYGDGRQDMRDIAGILYNPEAIRYIDRNTRNEILEVLSEAVVYNIHGAGRSAARGLSFCYPTGADSRTLDMYARNCPSAWYLAYLDAISDWNAPEQVYEKAERLPEIKSIEDYQLTATKWRKPGEFPCIVINNFFDNLGGVYYRLYYDDPNSEQLVCLGRTSCRTRYDEAVEKGILLYANEPWMWPSVDGVPCTMDMLKEQETSNEKITIYGIPVQIGSEMFYLRCDRVDPYMNGKRTYEINGAWADYNQNNQMASRTVTKLTELTGREFKLLWVADNSRGTGEKHYIPSGLTQKIVRGMMIEEQLLPAGTYYLEYEVDDMFLRPYVMERIMFYWDGEKATYPEDFTWEGEVQLNWAGAE